MKLFIELTADEVRQALNGGLMSGATVVSNSPRYTAKGIHIKRRGARTSKADAQRIMADYAITKCMNQTAKNTGIPYHRVVRVVRKPTNYGLTKSGTIPHYVGPLSGPRKKTAPEKAQAVLMMRQNNIPLGTICHNTGLAYTTVRRIIRNPGHWAVAA